MEEITACLYTDGDDLLENENGNKRKEQEISGVRVCLSMWGKIRCKAQVDRLALGAQAVHSQKKREGRINIGITYCQ